MKKYKTYKKEGAGHEFVESFDELIPAIVFAKENGNMVITKIKKGKEVIVAEF